MALHIVKLCVGADTIDDLVHWQRHVMSERRKRGLGVFPTHETRMMPKRADEVLDGGSLYWVIKRVIQVRQRITGIEAVEDRYGKSYCQLQLDPELVRTDPVGKRPFQGWRYLKAEDAPADLGKGEAKDVPPELNRALREAGVW